MGAKRHKVSSDEVHQLMIHGWCCRIEEKKSLVEGRCCSKNEPSLIRLVLDLMNDEALARAGDDRPAEFPRLTLISVEISCHLSSDGLVMMSQGKGNDITVYHRVISTGDTSVLTPRVCSPITWVLHRGGGRGGSKGVTDAKTA